MIRTPGGVRVDVTRGKVRVVSSTQSRFIVAGESWTNTPTITAELAQPLGSGSPPAAGPADLGQGQSTSTPTASDPARVEPERVRRPDAMVRPSRDIFETAQRVERSDPAGAAREYRKAANSQGEWAAIALYSLAELEVSRRRSESALAAVKEYLRRFPTGANVEDAAWLRVEILRTNRKDEAARDAAVDYLRLFPSGTYATTARRLAETR